MEMGEVTRRGFMQTTLSAGMLLGLAQGVQAQGGDPKTVRLALIGCGGRGRGALVGALQVAPKLGLDVKVVALADWFRERALQAGQQFGVPEDQCFGGVAGYHGVMESEADAVYLVEAPLFRPLHLEAAIAAGKHVFLEKPVAVDPPGCRRVIAAGEEAARKGLSVISGTERRHDWNYWNTHQALAVEGQLGKLYGGRVSFCIGHMFHTQPINPKNADDLVASWQNWLCLSGDHIVEQHVHNIDTANWFCGRVPVSATGFGGRARRNAGDMYDFFSVDFDYGEGLHIHSMCRQVNGCANWDGQEFVYERGTSNGSDHPTPRNPPMPADLPQGEADHLQEQLRVLYQVAGATPVDMARAVAESSASAVMGRISAYTGKTVTWNQIMGDPDAAPDLYNLALHPTAEEFEAGTIEIPAENVVPIPGE